MIDKEFKRHGINLSEEEYPDFLQKLMIKSSIIPWMISMPQ